MNGFDRQSYDKWQRVQAARDERSDYNPMDWGLPAPKQVVNERRPETFIIYDEVSGQEIGETRIEENISPRQQKRARMALKREEQQAAKVAEDLRMKQELEAEKVRETLGFGDW